MGDNDVSRYTATFDKAIEQANKRNRTRSRVAFTKAIMELLKTKTFNEIRISELIALSGYSRTAFYSNYEDKYDWAKQTIDQEMNVYLAYSQDYKRASSCYNSDEIIVSLIEKYMQHIADNLELYDALLTDKIPTPPVTVTCEKIKEGFGETVIGALYFDMEGFDPDFYNYLQLMGSFLHLEYWRQHDWSFTPHEMAVKIHAYLRTQEPFVAYRPQL